jgi:hypothetical protein
MHSDALAYLSAIDLADLIRRKQVSPVEVVGGCWIGSSW